MSDLNTRLERFFRPSGLGWVLLRLFGVAWLLTTQGFVFAKERTLYTEHTCESLDPRTAISAPCIGLLGNVYERLTTIDSATGAVLPALAKRWSMDYQAKRIEFELDQNRYWSDGKPVTANDIIAAWTSIVKNQLKTNSALGTLMQIQGADELVATADVTDQPSTEHLSGLSAPSPYQLRVQFATLDPVFHRRVASIQLSPIPQHSYAQHGESWATERPLPVNGLYQVTEQAQSLLLTPNPSHPAHDTLAIRRIESHKAQINHTSYGKHDLRELVEQEQRVSYLALRDRIDDHARRFIARNHWRIQPTITASTRLLLLNQNTLPTEMINTLNCAISSAEYVSRNHHEDLFEAKRLIHLPNLTLPALSWQRPARCHSLPPQTAHAQTTPHAAPRTLELLTYFEGKRLKSNAALQAMLRPHNIRLNSQLVSISDLDTRGTSGNYQALLFSWQANINDPTVFLSLAESISSWLKPQTKQRVSALIQRANSLGHDHQRLRLLDEAERLMLEDGGLIPLATTKTYFLVDKALCGFQVNGNELVDYGQLHWC